MPGSAILIGGHPGAGKSTLLLQAHVRISEKYDRTLCNRGRVTSTSGYAS